MVDGVTESGESHGGGLLSHTKEFQHIAAIQITVKAHQKAAA